MVAPNCQFSLFNYQIRSKPSLSAFQFILQMVRCARSRVGSIAIFGHCIKRFARAGILPSARKAAAGPCPLVAALIAHHPTID